MGTLNMFRFTTRLLLALIICESGIIKLTIRRFISSLMVWILSMFCWLMSNLSLVLNPRWKLTYVEAAWDHERIESNMGRLRKIVSSMISIFLI